ncbi:MAG: DUF4091 domain-containing protein, partial [Oscillospiraceae bacterium]
MKNLDMRIISSLEKVFLDSELNVRDVSRLTMLKNEKLSFQCALKLNSVQYGKAVASINVKSKLAQYITVYEVGHIPGVLTSYPEVDDGYITTKPGLFPDLLTKTETVDLMTGQWRSIWITIKGEDLPSGTFPVEIELVQPDIDISERESIEIEIINASLPKQELLYTQWVHYDCIAQYHKTEVFDERFWALTEKYIKLATDNGINTILTPLFTPPLDTKIGGERLTVQLVDVYLEGDEYSFGFDKLLRFVNMCNKNGVLCFEFSHLFTQWGAKCAPKIVAKRNGETIKLFGWETEARSEKYRAFLESFLKQLLKFIDAQKLRDRCCFHVSDEPMMENIDDYRYAYEFIENNIEGMPIIDALSDFDFYEKNITKIPIPSIDHMKPFLEADIEKRWTYFCCSQYLNVPNRFFSLPSYRNRILGMQLYKYNMDGFLHWGYNFYNTRFSLAALNPYEITDAAGGFPSGDSFLVYPTEDGATPSIRLFVTNEAMQDVRALKLLEKLKGRDFVLDLIGMSIAIPALRQFVMNVWR